MDHPPLTFPGSNINLVKAHNLRAILMTLLYETRISRTRLAERTALSSTTITNLVAELIEQGVLIEEGAGAEDSPYRIGRPRTSLRLAPNARYAVGVHIGIGILRIALTNLSAEIVEKSMTCFAIDDPPARVLDQIAVQIQQIIASSGVDRRNILGVGVGASGLVDIHNGVNVLAPSLGWRNVPIRDQLQAALNLPVCIDNNVRAMALGEARFGAGRGATVMAFVYGRVGVGAGFVVAGQVYRGSLAGAGEIGHLPIFVTGGDRCSCGNSGCLETLVSETALVRQAQQLAAAHPTSLLAQYLSAPGEEKPLERLFAAARAADPYATAMIAERAGYLGIALANIVNMFNPELILLGGIFAQGKDLILPAAEKTMRQRSFPGLGSAARIQTTTFGWKAGLTGAAALALDTFFYQRTDL